MKRKIFGIFKLLAFCIICCSLFVGGGYFYLRQNFRETENKVSSVPYSFSAPESKGIMLEICGSPTYLYLDFYEERLKVIIPPEKEYGEDIYGYPIDFIVKTDYRFVAAVIDYADGIELNLDGEALRYTGVQISALGFGCMRLKEIEQPDGTSRKGLRCGARPRDRKRDDEIRAVHQSHARAGVRVHQRSLSALDEPAAHHAHNCRRAVFARAGYMICVAVMERIIFGNDACGAHRIHSFSVFRQ